MMRTVLVRKFFLIFCFTDQEEYITFEVKGKGYPYVDSGNNKSEKKQFVPVGNHDQFTAQLVEVSEWGACMSRGFLHVCMVVLSQRLPLLVMDPNVWPLVGHEGHRLLGAVAVLLHQVAAHQGGASCPASLAVNVHRRTLVLSYHFPNKADASLKNRTLFVKPQAGTYLQAISFWHQKNWQINHEVYLCT